MSLTGRMNVFILFLLTNVEALTTHDSPLSTPISSFKFQLKARQTTPFSSICGYSSGNTSITRSAEPGYICGEDTVNHLWGFCPNTIVNNNNCGFAGYCVDIGTCSTGCGVSSLSPISWYVYVLRIDG